MFEIPKELRHVVPEVVCPLCQGGGSLSGIERRPPYATTQQRRTCILCAGSGRLADTSGDRGKTRPAEPS